MAFENENKSLFPLYVFLPVIKDNLSLKLD